MDIVGMDRARSRFAEMVDRAQAAPVIVTRNGEPAVVMLAPDDYESLMATVELLSNPEYHRRMDGVARAPEDYVSHDDVVKELRSRRRARGVA